MLNRYDDGSIHIGKHSDNIENKVIVTVSLGADRSWIMERKAPRGQKVDKDEKIRRRWTLKGGSLLVMQGATQKHYTHEIPKELKIKEPRIVSLRTPLWPGCVINTKNLLIAEYHLQTACVQLKSGEGMFSSFEHSSNFTMPASCRLYYSMEEKYSALNLCHGGLA